MAIREIEAKEIPMLYDCVKALSEYHNEVSLYHKGSYPTNPYEWTLEKFAKDADSGLSKFAVIEDGGKIVGFSKVDLEKDCGKLDYLIVLEAYRGRGYGGALMDWAMAKFKVEGISKIEVKVVAGNETVHLYEKYGFRLNAQILRYTEE